MRIGWKNCTGIVTAIVVNTLVGVAPAAERTHDITLDDYLSVYLLTDCEMSSDGKYVAFTELRWFDPDEKRSTELWVVDTETRKPLRLTFNRVNDGSPHWAPDNQHLYFVSSQDRGEEKPPYDGTTQVWVTGPHPGEPLAITRARGGIQSYQLSADGTTLYYTKDGEKAKQDWKELRKKYADIEFNYGDITYTEIWKLNLETWREEKIVAPERVILEFQVSPDQQRIAMITAPDARLFSREGWSRVDVYDVAGGETTSPPEDLYRGDKAPSPYGWLENLTWSPNSQALAYTVSYDGYPSEILIAEWPGGAPKVWPLKRARQVHFASHLKWAPGGRDLCFLGEEKARRRMYRVANVRNGTQDETQAVTPGDVVLHDFTFSKDGKRLAVIKSDTESSRDVFLVAPGQAPARWRQLSDTNPQMATWKLPKIEHVTWKSVDGTEVGGILELPPGYTSDQGPLPMVVELHGGPTACTLLHMRYWIYGRTIFAARGYALLSPNYRGSTGYGDKFLTDLIGHENDRDVKDVLAGVDAMIERGIADPERLGVMGWSNGGFMTNALITTTQRFKAASSGAGVLDQLMQWGLEDTPGHVVNYMRGLPWERQEAYLKASPAYQLGQVTTPTIVHVGERDARVPPAHSQTLYRALREYTDTPTVLLVYPKAGHGLAVSDHRKGKLEWDLAWFDRYLLGKTEESEPE